ncbi:hypothetical protein ACHAW6_013208 [Cyclotella cf. meneghiniana]
MSKRTSSDETTKACDKKRPRSQRILRDDWLESIKQSIETADTAGCREIQCELRQILEDLIGKSKERILQLEKENKIIEQEKEIEGLRYKGEDEVKCACGSTFRSGGEYSRICDGQECFGREEEERCSKCAKKCQGENCEKNLCNDCSTRCKRKCGKNVLCDDCLDCCQGCDKIFCKSCVTECHTCCSRLCDGDRVECSVNFGFGGELYCQYCVKESMGSFRR